MAEKKKISKKHIVVFQDEDNTVLKTSFVPHGEAAIPPEIAVKKGETTHHEVVFDHWDTDYSEVNDNLVVKAVYKTIPKHYLVIYYHENDKMIGMESVPYGQAAKAQPRPKKQSDAQYDYIFVGWNCALNHISKDTNARAVFVKKRRKFTVRFFHEDGVLLREELVEYGHGAHPPTSPEKSANPTYHYVFEKWDKDADSITENMDIYAIFKSIYNEYTVSFYDEERAEKLISSGKYHYGDEILFPDVSKRGYDLRWSDSPGKADRDYELYAFWTFSNPAGKKAISGKGVYEIINPSVKNGSVRCLQYEDEAVRVSLPEKVLIGDYYYKVEAIGAGALKECRNMQMLHLPENVRTIEDYGLAYCRQLKWVQFGKKITSFGASAFAGDVRLQEICLPGDSLKKCHKKIFEEIKTPVTFLVEPRHMDKVRSMLHYSPSIRIGKISGKNMHAR